MSSGYFPTASFNFTMIHKMKPLFHIGLSLMPSLHTRTIAEQREQRSAEGLRIVSLLDAAAASPREANFGKFIAREPEGRPYFSDYHADFNISHSRNMVAAAFLMMSEKARRKLCLFGKGSTTRAPKKLLLRGRQACFSKRRGDEKLGMSGRIGCDVQYLAPGKSFVEISRRFFHAGEQAYIEEDPAAQMRNFYQIWVLKEAWLKLHGLSVFDMAKTPAFSIGGDPHTGTDKSGLVFFLYELSSPDLPDSESYMFAAVCQRVSSSDGEVEPEIRWFSDAVLTLNRVENVYAAQSPENTVMPKI
jgi:phosphopantetheinyl transferase